MRDPRERRPIEPARVELLTRAANAARELCELLWDAVHEELRDPSEERVRELSQRLSEVSSTVALLASSSPTGPGVPTPRPGRGAAPESQSSPAATPAPSPAAAPAPPPDAGHERRTPPEPIWRESPPPPPGPPPPAPIPHPAAFRPPGEAGEESARARMRLVDERDEREESMREVRREEGPSAWVSTVGGLLERHSRDGLPFAVLLVELVDIARIEHSEAPLEVNRLISQVEHALCAAMRSEDTLTRESLGRYWLVAPETNGTGARMLAERLARLVRSSASHRGVPLEVAVGIAVCPEDGTEAPTLAARADLGVFSARATGRTVARTEPPG